MRLLEPLPLGRMTAPNRVLFGPHETNLGDRRALSARHIGYYERRMVGGAGIVVVEEASVHASDWPYERCPLASECGPGWRELAGRAAAHGTVVVAGLSADATFHAVEHVMNSQTAEVVVIPDKGGPRAVVVK